MMSILVSAKSIEWDGFFGPASQGSMMRVITFLAGWSVRGTILVVVICAETSWAHTMFIDQSPLIHGQCFWEGETFFCNVVMCLLLFGAPCALHFQVGVISLCSKCWSVVRWVSFRVPKFTVRSCTACAISTWWIYRFYIWRWMWGLLEFRFCFSWGIELMDVSSISVRAESDVFGLSPSLRVIIFSTKWRFSF